MSKQVVEINKHASKIVADIKKKFSTECANRGIPDETIDNIIRSLDEKYRGNMRLLTIPAASASAPKKSTKAPTKKDGVVWKKLKDTEYSFTTDIKFGKTRGYIKDTAHKIVAGLNKDGHAVSLSEDDIRYLTAQCLVVEPLSS